MAPSILVVEDEPEVRELLNFTISRAGYEVIEAVSAEQALGLTVNNLPDLAIVDWMLPGINGVDLVQRFRQDEYTAKMPVMMLTARGEEADKLRSFDQGVDDYVTKPFSPRELVARIKALLRRSGQPTDNKLTHGDITIDLDSHIVSVGGNQVHIGPTEYRLLELLMRQPNRAFDRGQLLDRVWGRSVYVEERTVDVHILRLRKILQPYQLDGLIQTVRGVGYRLSPPE